MNRLTTGDSLQRIRYSFVPSIRRQLIDQRPLFYLFTMPVACMILIHVMYLTSVSYVPNSAVTWAVLGGVILDILSPWLISYVSPIFVVTMLTGATLMTISFLVMMTAPLYEMWALGQPSMGRKQPSNS